jgi:hypothetical protein
MATSNVIQEHRGLVKVYAVCTEMNAIWRPTNTTDLGIDGQIEFLEVGSSISTGQLVAVQVKSGPSYFANKREDAIEFYPTEKHRRYWRRLSLPVILVLHNPDDDLTIFTRVKRQLTFDGPIAVSLNSRFDSQSRECLLGIASDDLRLVPPGQVLADFQRAKYVVGQGKEIDGIHFLLASVHPSLPYLEVRMCRITALLELASDESGIFIGSDTYEFLLRCVMKVWKHQLTEPFVEHFEESWYGLQMVPDIVVPMTPFGLAVLEHLWTRIDDYLTPDVCGTEFGDATRLGHAIAETPQLTSDRLDASDRLGETPR